MDDRFCADRQSCEPRHSARPQIQTPLRAFQEIQECIDGNPGRKRPSGTARGF